jgi:hypothetical protein
MLQQRRWNAIKNGMAAPGLWNLTRIVRVSEAASAPGPKTAAPGVGVRPSAGALRAPAVAKKRLGTAAWARRAPTGSSERCTPSRLMLRRHPLPGQVRPLVVHPQASEEVSAGLRCLGCASLRPVPPEHLKHGGEASVNAMALLKPVM